MSRRHRMKKPPEFHGIVLVDKPAGMTSHDVVDFVRRVSGQRQVGHTGTLDPAATGLLVMCLGEATKLTEHFTRLEKVYTGEMVLGSVSTTYDGDGEISAVDGARPVEAARLRASTEAFLGEIRQVPPIHSAKKVAGKRLYEYARKGEEVEIEPRAVTVRRFSIKEYAWPRARFEVECGSGTYVRRLVHDLGEDLGCGAYLSALRRERVGSFRVEDAVGLDALGEQPERLGEWVRSLGECLGDWPQARLSEAGLVPWRSGHAVPLDWAPLTAPARALNWLDPVLIVDEQGGVLGIARYVPAPSSPPPKALSEYRGAWLQPIRQLHIPSRGPEGGDSPSD